jgi:hypothetical protein
MLIFAWISIIIQGFDVGGNNIYHIPLILNWAKEPAFRDDNFVQSLDNYVSAFWILVKPFANENNIFVLFYGLHLLVRWMSILGLVMAAKTLCRTKLSTQVALGLWFSITPLLRIGSWVGWGELFTTEFSHTEVALPLILFSLVFAVRGRLDFAFAVDGIIFDINAFVAVWTGCALMLAAFAVISQNGPARQILLRRYALGLAAGILLALPVVVWIVLVLRNQEPHADFDYVEYLRVYFPNHFLIAAATPRALATLVGIGAGGFIGFRELGAAGLVWRRAFLGFCLIFAIGAVLPELTHAPALLNLHLLRVDGVIQVIGLLGLSVAAMQRLEGTSADRLLGVGALVILSLPNPAGMLLAGATVRNSSTTPKFERVLVFVLAPVILACGIDYAWPRQIVVALCQGSIAVICVVWPKREANWFIPDKKWLAGAVVAVAGVVATENYLGVLKRNADLRSGAMSQIAYWAHNATEPTSVFLIPVDNASASALFEILSHRRIWVDQKRGAAVMWTPAYYFEWKQRLQEVRALVSLAEKRVYSCLHK